ncbi:MAG: mandelate racemase/muconate lactonizing enzyme family protein [Dehalococcoidia bacterium]|nr:mandelate racemase/muconate lactonizing enzyme family protein [Dehalococcoidia bacterium]
MARVRWRRVAVPFTVTVTNAQAAYRVRESVLIEVEADGGLRGIGEASLPAGASFDAHALDVQAFLRAAAAAAIGRGASGGFAHLRLPAFVPGEWSGAAVCGVATALADVAARTAGLPLYRWLAKEARLPLAAGPSKIDVNGLVDLTDPGAAAESAVALVRDGFRTIKLKVGGSPERSIATVAAVRVAVGPGVVLRCDANRSWGRAEAEVFLSGCTPYAVALCEEPLGDPGPDYGALAELRAASTVPLAVDESTRTVDALERVIAAEGADALVVKPMASGLEEAMAMVRRARDAGLPAIVTTTFDLAPGTAVAMHLAALVGSPGPACGLGTAGLVTDLLGHGLPEVHRGSIALPETPGLGIEFDYQAIERYAAGPWEEAAA